MMRKLTIKATMVLGGALACPSDIMAQSFAMEYTTEWQTDFKGGYNWANLMYLSTSIPVTRNLTLQGATISVASTDAETLFDDLQGYSNIDADNQPLAIAVLGAEMTISHSTLFLGVRNVNEDYFTSPVTSFFSNSSCGIFPTLSANYDIANYPLSSFCAHYRFESDRLVLQTSLYEGAGHSAITGHDNVFTFSPSKNGLFSITSAEYISHDSNYNLGCALFYGVCGRDDNGVESETPLTLPSQHKKVSIAPWINIEQRLSDKCNLLAQGSVAAGGSVACKYYFGLGSTLQIKKITLGAFADFAKFKVDSESILEIICQIPISSKLSAIPTMEFIKTGKSFNTVGMMRFNLRIG